MSARRSNASNALQHSRDGAVMSGHIWPSTKCASAGYERAVGARCAALGKRDGCAGCSRIAWPLDQRRRELTVTYAPGHSTRYDMRHRSRVAAAAVDEAPRCYLLVYPPNTLNLSITHSFCHRSIAHVSHISRSPCHRAALSYRPTSCLADKVRHSTR